MTRGGCSWSVFANLRLAFRLGFAQAGGGQSESFLVCKQERKPKCSVVDFSSLPCSLQESQKLADERAAKEGLRAELEAAKLHLGALKFRSSLALLLVALIFLLLGPYAGNLPSSAGSPDAAGEL